MKDKYDDEAEKMIHELVKKLKYEYPGSVFNVSSHILEFDIGNTIPLAELLRDKARLDGIIKYSATWKSREICDEHLAAVREGKK